MSRNFFLRAGLSDHPVLAEELGQLNVAWSALEYRIFGLFEILTGLPVPVAKAIYYSQRTTYARIELVSAVAPVVLRRRQGRTGLGKTTRELKKVAKVMGEIGQMSGDRNKYVHDPWGSTEFGKKPHQLRLRGKDIHGYYERVRLRELRQLVLKIETKTDILHRLYDYLAPKLLPLHGRLELQHELTLVPSQKVVRPKRKKAKPRRAHH
jgi:hypothetical protein